MNTREQLQTLLHSKHSMREIGRAAGVTHHTVSKVVNGHSIKPESFKKIELAVTNLTQLDAQKAEWTAAIKAGVLATPCTKQAQITDLIARLAAADVEREQIMRRCNVQSDNLRTYQERLALLECEIKVYKPALEAAENACIYHQQETMDAHHDHAMTIEEMNSLARGSRNKSDWLMGEYNAACAERDELKDALDKNIDDLKRQTRLAKQFVFERDTVNVERLHLKSECQRMAADSLFLQGLRIGFKYTAVFLVMLLIVAGVCWFGGV